MGNEKSNSHWEAELPPNYNRVGIDKFICAKYDLTTLLLLTVTVLPGTVSLFCNYL